MVGTCWVKCCCFITNSSHSRSLFTHHNLLVCPVRVSPLSADYKVASAYASPHSDPILSWELFLGFLSQHLSWDTSPTSLFTLLGLHKNLICVCVSLWACEPLYISLYGTSEFVWASRNRFRWTLYQGKIARDPCDVVNWTCFGNVLVFANRESVVWCVISVFVCMCGTLGLVGVYTCF